MSMWSGRCHSFYGPRPRSCWVTSSWCSALVRSRMSPAIDSTLGSHYFACWCVKSKSFIKISAYILMVPMIGKIRDNAGRRAVLKTLKVHTGRLAHLVMPLAIQISYKLSYLFAPPSSSCMMVLSQLVPPYSRSLIIQDTFASFYYESLYKCA